MKVSEEKTSPLNENSLPSTNAQKYHRQGHLTTFLPQNSISLIRQLMYSNQWFHPWNFLCSYKNLEKEMDTLNSPVTSLSWGPVKMLWFNYMFHIVYKYLIFLPKNFSIVFIFLQYFKTTFQCTPLCGYTCKVNYKKRHSNPYNGLHTPRVPGSCSSQILRQ
jgi:hypothetical protein